MSGYVTPKCRGLSSLVNVVAAVVSGFAIFAGSDRYLREFAATLCAVVILASAHVTIDRLLIFHVFTS